MVDPGVIGVTWKKQLWHKWKALRSIPFRKSWFVGYDLEGNSYWEMVDHNNPSRLRRKVSLDRPYFHFSDFKPHPMWMQWLQFTRPSAPTLIDLTNDAKRRYQLKLLAKQADAKWKSIPLKSGQSSSTQDPRIDTSWSGTSNVNGRTESTTESATESAAEQGQTFTAPEQLNAQPGSGIHEQLKKAMKQAEARRQQAPKVVRDHLGQVKVHEDPKPQPEEAASQSKQSSSPPPPSEDRQKDQPQSAFFQPKSRT